MGMAYVPPLPKWDDEHTTPVEMTYVVYSGTSDHYRETGPRFTVRVCSTCRGSREWCKCPWRKRR